MASHCAKVENGVVVQYPYIGEVNIEQGILPVTLVKPDTFLDEFEAWNDPEFSIGQYSVTVTLTKRPK